MQDKFRVPLYLIPVLALIPSLISGTLMSCSEPPEINYFTASPTEINSGQAVTLQWDVSGVTRVTISGIGPVPPYGTAIVTPSLTTTYLLTVPKSTQSRSLTINVRSTADVVRPEPASADEPPPTTAADESSFTSITLQYDNLDSTNDYYLQNQLAIWHTYAKLAGSSSLASAGYSVDARRAFTASSTTGIPVKSPLIILPFREGMVCIIKNYSNLSYQYYKLGTAWYFDQMDESGRLKEPGWGLMTNFSPPQTPFKIQKLNIAGIANLAGTPDDYNKRLFVVRILDENGSQIWTKTLPWSIFQSGSSEEIPVAVWRSIDVDGVSVSRDFSVEVLTESREYITGRNPSYNYLALAYEKITSKDVTTRSMISEEGRKPESWVRLYNQYGQPLAFNLCIRVEGSYSSK